MMPQNVPNEQKLTPKQEQLIAALIAGNSYTAAAAALGLDRKTVSRWLKLPHFQEAYRGARQYLYTESINKLMLYTDDAVTVLHAIMMDEEAQPAVKLRAVQITLEQASEQYKTSELEKKIEQLEQLLAEQPQEKR